MEGNNTTRGHHTTGKHQDQLGYAGFLAGMSGFIPGVSRIQQDHRRNFVGESSRGKVTMTTTPHTTEPMSRDEHTNDTGSDSSVDLT
ncbi:hypothetical protein, partial [Corynebacterium falsenii]|uniref:hypothetical protein n=1 Tax=Corynebacterium falsenii TaxID=108486 RepID=UPI001D425FD9